MKQYDIYRRLVAAGYAVVTINGKQTFRKTF
jgi:hypothetical protein